MFRRHDGPIRVRPLLGAALALFGVFVLFGGLFVPFDVILRDPGVVPAPESWIAVWIIAVGLVIALWPPKPRDRTDR